MQAFLTGQELPVLSVAFRLAPDGLVEHEKVHATALEADMQRIVADPSLAHPRRQGGVLLPPGLLLGPPAGKAAPLHAEVEQWISGGALQRLHAQKHKVQKWSAILLLTVRMTHPVNKHHVKTHASPRIFLLC